MEMLQKVFQKIAWPLLLILMITPLSLALGITLIYEGYRSSLRGEYLQVSVGRIKLEIPKNWWPQAFEEKIGEGSRNVAFLIGENCTIGIFVYDNQTTGEYFKGLNSSNMKDVIRAKARLILDLYLKEFPQAELRSLENGTVSVCGSKAQYSIFSILNLGDRAYVKVLIVAWMCNGLIELNYLGLSLYWERNLSRFNYILGSVRCHSEE